jgi:hypothetical protein
MSCESSSQVHRLLNVQFMNYIANVKDDSCASWQLTVILVSYVNSVRIMWENEVPNF